MKTHLGTRIPLGAIAVLLLASPCFARKQDTGFLNRTVQVAGTEYRYQVYVPANWTPTQKWPVILFLHGWGEKGTDGLQHTQVGIGVAIRSHADRYPFIVVFPQCREGRAWSDDDMMQLAFATLQAATKEFHGDADRTYLTGLSMGGFGTWEIASRYPHKFAAIAPICGGIHWPDQKDIPDRLRVLHREPDAYDVVAREIGRTPVWAFHGDADPIIPVAESRLLVDALKKAGGNVRYTEYPGVDHNSWDKAYAEHDFPTWLLQQKLAGPHASTP